MTKKTTLRDIARQANVAVSTVSQVLNHKPGVRPETRQAVLDAANELGYRQKVTIDSVLAPQMNTIGLLTKLYADDALLMNPFYAPIIVGAERECQRHGISMMYANVEVDQNNRVLSLPSMLLDERVDGVIVIGALLEETHSEISLRTRRNVVLVDSYTMSSGGFDSVLIDNVSGAFEAVSYLIASGHRHIGLIGSHAQSYPAVLERRQGYLAALAKHNLESHIEDGILDRADAFQATLRLINHVPGITAIFACNDNVAIGVMNAIQSVGLRVPQDISIIGFDDIAPAHEVSPALTTVFVDKALMGALAVRHLRDRAVAPDRMALKTMISTRLIRRESVRTLLP